ncbi:hypothetical protein CARUB_v10002360mg [Capsella rubella]|uniref:Uncharacterized protein n=1 Tax=Capsella rubella TaxID=81985 RepID=R0GYB1_9BRAS|nr:hypothetical protein CARUB_v10002360mg [Capsella rubella]
MYPRLMNSISWIKLGKHDQIKLHYISHVCKTCLLILLKTQKKGTSTYVLVVCPVSNLGKLSDITQADKEIYFEVIFKLSKTCQVM